MYIGMTEIPGYKCDWCGHIIYVQGASKPYGWTHMLYIINGSPIIKHQCFECRIRSTPNRSMF
jgi:hypothetical protein